MNKIKYSIALLLALTLVGFSCKSTPEDVAFKTTGTVVITANAALSAWLDYKNTVQPPPPQDQIDKVKSAWDKYYAAVQVEKAAVVAYKTNPSATNGLNSAIVIANATSADLVALVVQFLPAKNVTEIKGVK